MLWSMNEMGEIGGIGAIAGFGTAQQKTVVTQATAGFASQAGRLDIVSTQDGANFVFELATGGQRQNFLQRSSQFALG